MEVGRVFRGARERMLCLLFDQDQLDLANLVKPGLLFWSERRKECNLAVICVIGVDEKLHVSVLRAQRVLFYHLPPRGILPTPTDGAIARLF